LKKTGSPPRLGKIQACKEDEIILQKTKSANLWIRIAVISLAFLVIAGFLISQALSKRINHDENQYIACAELIGEGYVPYHDFLYFHLPYLPYIYAGLFSFTDHLLLSSRIFSALCALTYLFLIYLLVAGRFEFLSKNGAAFFAISAVFLITATGIFRHTATLSWSHDFPIMLIVLAFFLFAEFFQNDRKILLFFSGILLGTAVMARLTYIFSILPFFLVLFAGARMRAWRNIVPRIIFLVSGFLASLLPLLILIADRAAFENFTYSIYDYHFRFDQIFLREMGWIPGSRLQFELYSELFLDKRVFLPFLSVFASIYLLIKHRKNVIAHRELLLALLIAIFSFAGTISREVAHKQYFLIIVIFLILNLYLLISGFELFRSRLFYRVSGILILAVLLWDPSHLVHAWGRLDGGYMQEVHAQGVKIRQIVKDEKVVTLSPLWCLEGGCGIYPEFVNGVFSWRVGSCETVPETRFTNIRNIEAFYRRYQPQYLYTGHEKIFEQNLIDFFVEKGFKPTEIDDQGVLWMK